jgi:NADH dehydrogenase FAD-containing subunit
VTLAYVRIFIYKLEHAELLARENDNEVLKNNNDNNQNKRKKNSLLTFVIIGGGFAGDESAGELNDITYDQCVTIVIIYKDVRILIIQSGNRLIPEMSKDFRICYAKKLASRFNESYFKYSRYICYC